MEIKSMITLINESLGFLPAYAEDAGAWEESFANRQKFLRFHIGNLIVLSGDGLYEGDVGDHGLSLCGISVRVRDGYRALLQAWLGAAKARLGDKTSIPAPSPRLAAIAPELLAFVKDFASLDPVFVKGQEKQRIADARALVAKAGAA